MNSNIATVNVTVNRVNDAPQGTNNAVTTLENANYTFKASDFGFTNPSDTPPDSLLAVKITTLPAAGSLTDNGTALKAGDFVSATDINAGNLLFVPANNTSGTVYTSFTFQVEDNGGTANGGVDLDPTPRTMTVNVTHTKPPVLVAISDQTVTELETLSFTAAANELDQGQTLTYSLGAGAPAGASIDPATGLFTGLPPRPRDPTPILSR